MKNATLPPSKRSTIERQMDIMVLVMFALLFAMCLAGSACFSVWTRARPARNPGRRGRGAGVASRRP
jgi:hypothetical protein